MERRKSFRYILEDGFDVIFNYIVNPTSLEMIKKEFENYNKKFVVLLVDEETLLSRDKERPEDSQMKDRCLVLLNNFKKHNFDSKNILDTSKLSIDETVKTIEENDKFYI